MEPEVSLYRERALLKFRRYYFHSIRDQASAGKEVDTEKAATDAMWKAREEILAMLRIDPDIETDIDREEVWADALVDIMFFRQLLVNLPIDAAKLYPKMPLANGEIADPKLTPTNSGKIAGAYETGVETKIKQEDHDARGS